MTTTLRCDFCATKYQRLDASQAAFDGANRAAVSTTEALSGLFGAALGGGGLYAFGLTHVVYNSMFLDSCAATVIGVPALLIARFLGPARQRRIADDQRAQLQFRREEARLKSEILRTLPDKTSPTMRDAFAKELLQTVNQIGTTVKSTETAFDDPVKQLPDLT